MKRETIFIIFFLFLIVLCLSFVSAGVFNDFWNKITGKVAFTDCNNSCSSLGYECGYAFICGTNFNCGNCEFGSKCVEGVCLIDNDSFALCGNGIQEIGEQCDGEERAISASCSYFGYASGALGCNDDCTFDFSECLISNCTDSDGGIVYDSFGSLNISSNSDAILLEGEIVYVAGKYISIAFIDSSSVRLNIDELIITSSLSEGESYLDRGSTIRIDSINYNSSHGGVNSVYISVLISPIMIPSDSCTNLTFLEEFYCDRNMTPKKIIKNCMENQEICFDGACVSSPKCIDSDGVNYYTKGNITYFYGGLSSISNDKSSVSDFCSENKVNEGYCFLDNEGISQFGWKGMACKYGCINGACKKFLGIFRTSY